MIKQILEKILEILVIVKIDFLKIVKLIKKIKAIVSYLKIADSFCYRRRKFFSFSKKFVKIFSPKGWWLHIGSVWLPRLGLVHAHVQQLVDVDIPDVVVHALSCILLIVVTHVHILLVRVRSIWIAELGS
jgi:hypothetical protein